MTNEEAISEIKVILEEATETEDAVCYVTSVDAESLNLAIEALKKQIPKKIISKDDDDYGDCPVCGKILRYRSEAYCYNCGQKYVWKVVEG